MGKSMAGGRGPGMGPHPIAAQVHRGDPLGAVSKGYGNGHTGAGANSGKKGAKRTASKTRD